MVVSGASGASSAVPWCPNPSTHCCASSAHNQGRRKPSVLWVKPARPPQGLFCLGDRARGVGGLWVTPFEVTHTLWIHRFLPKRGTRSSSSLQGSQIPQRLTQSNVNSECAPKPPAEGSAPAWDAPGRWGNPQGVGPRGESEATEEGPEGDTGALFPVALTSRPPQITQLSPPHRPAMMGCSAKASAAGPSDCGQTLQYRTSTNLLFLQGDELKVEA